MNDPHVKALLYCLKHRDAIDFERCDPMSEKRPEFRVDLDGNGARFAMKQHFATEREARQVVDPFVKAWEFDVSLDRGPGLFKLVFQKAEIIDRSPTPGAHVVKADPIRFSFTTSAATVRMSPPRFPHPPEVGKYGVGHPDVQLLWQRYEGYKDGRELLAEFAYLCLTVLEQVGGRKAAAKTYNVDYSILNKIGDLSSNKGGLHARKVKGTGADFTDEERKFLERETVKLIRRVAEFHGGRHYT